MKLTTQRDLIRSVSKVWRDRYEPFTDDDKPLFSARTGLRRPIPKKPIAEKLDDLDKETATAADVAAIIGNESWTRLECDECGKDVAAVLTVGERTGYGRRTASICQDCAKKIAAITLQNFQHADKP